MERYLHETNQQFLQGYCILLTYPAAHLHAHFPVHKHLPLHVVHAPNTCPSAFFASYVTYLAVPSSAEGSRGSGRGPQHADRRGPLC